MGGVYTEPGIQVVQVSDSTLGAPAIPPLLPVVVAEGPAYMQFFDQVLQRSKTQNYDVLPSTTVTSILRVGNTRGAADYVQGTDYQLTAPNEITWLNSGNSPSAGYQYYISWEARPEASQYQPQIISGFDQLQAAYGGHFMLDPSHNTVINPVGLGGYLMLEAGAQTIICLQVEPGGLIGTTPTGSYVVSDSDWTAALDLLVDVPSAYRIVPISEDLPVHAALIDHVLTYSDPFEGLERRGMLPYNSGATTMTELINYYSARATGIGQRRIDLLAPGDPGAVTKVLSDGNTYSLDGSYLAAALAGAAAIIPIWRSLTRLPIYNFQALSWPAGLRPRRQQLNLIAPNGVMILEQPGGTGNAIQVRHQLTTSYPLLTDREDSLVTQGDYCAKYLRAILSPMIGKYNINADLMHRLTIKANRAFQTTLPKLAGINGGGVTTMAQVDGEPDQIAANFWVKLAPPFNRLNLTLVLGV